MTGHLSQGETTYPNSISFIIVIAPIKVDIVAQILFIFLLYLSYSLIYLY